MASGDVLVLLFTTIWIVPVEPHDSFVKVQCCEKTVGLIGHTSLLKCGIHLTDEAKDAKISHVVWKKSGDNKALISFTEDGLKEAPGYKFAEPSWSETNMNVSLLITNTAVGNNGNYSCMVVTDSGDSITETRLEVKAPYRVPTVELVPERVPPNEDSMLVCQSHGGFPQGELRWFDVDNQDWTKSAEMEVKEMDSGLFQLTSKLHLLHGSTYSKFTCAVFNASGDKEHATYFEMPPTFDEFKKSEEKFGSTSKIVAPVLVIGSLIVGLLIVLLLKRRRQKAQRQFSTDEMNYHDEPPARATDVEEGVHLKDDKLARPEALISAGDLTPVTKFS